MSPTSRRGRARILPAIAAPALALILAGCGGAPDEVATGEVATERTAIQAETDTVDSSTASNSDAAEAPDASSSQSSDAAPPEESSVPEETGVPEETSATGETSDADAAGPAEPVIEKLSADVAIANAAANINGLQTADSVLDIEVLAVGDGSVQTMRNVVTGDRPVLVWFYSPH